LLQETDRVETPPDEVCNRLIALVKQVSGSTTVFPVPFPVATQLSELGISSLKMVNLMLAVELEFDIAIPQSDITPENFQSVSSIQALVGKMLSMRRT
jgi:acyl carrier protein